MKSALLISLILGALSARADFCSLCDSIRSPYGAQTIPLVYPEIEEDDDSLTEAALPASIRPRRPGLMRIQMDRLPPLQPERAIVRPSPVLGLPHQAAQLVNNERRRYGLPDLRLDESLNRAALEYAKILHDNYYSRGIEISHDQAGDLGRRLQSSGVRWSAVGENIARGHRTASGAVRGWLESPGHRQNILAETPAAQNFRRQGMAEYNGFWVNIFTD